MIFDLEFGSLVYPTKLGYVVLDDGMWQVSRETVCYVLTHHGVACPSG